MKKLFLIFALLGAIAFTANAQVFKLSGAAGDTVGISGTLTKYFRTSDPHEQIFTVQVHIDSVNGTPVCTCVHAYSNDKANWTTAATVIYTGVGADTTYYFSETTGSYYEWRRIYCSGSGGRSLVMMYPKVIINN